MEGYSCLLNLDTLTDIEFNICYDPPDYTGAWESSSQFGAQV